MKSLSLLLAGVVLAGCGAGSNESNAATGDGNEPLFTRTKVVINEDGTRDVRVSKITPAQRQMELAQDDAIRQANAAGLGEAQQASMFPCANGVCEDDSCAGTEVWMFDGAGYTGDELCLTTSATSGVFVSLYDFCNDGAWGSPPACDGPWGNQGIFSLKTHNFGGAFFTNTNGACSGKCSNNFAANTWYSPTDSCWQSAVAIQLNSTTCWVP